MKKRNIGREDLKNYYLNESALIDSGELSAKEIVKENGYDIDDLKKEGRSLISNLRRSSQKELNWNDILQKVTSLGFTKKFVEKRLVPIDLVDEINLNGEQELINRGLQYLLKVLGISKTEFIQSERLALSQIPSRSGRFKKASNANINQIMAYSHYAKFIAQTVLKGCSQIEQKSYPEDIDEFRSFLNVSGRQITLEGLLETIWSLGICVVPLSDAGIFHGASWNIKGRHVIILKQKSDSHAKWIFDLLHELYHVFAHLVDEGTSVIEHGEISPVAANESDDELESNSFANQMIFSASAEVLVQESVQRAKQKTELLKKAVREIAEETNVRTDCLANYMAYRLQFDGTTNWWGTADKLQVKDPSPATIVKEALEKRLDFKKLNEIESNMLSMALKTDYE